MQHNIILNERVLYVPLLYTLKIIAIEDKLSSHVK